MSEEVARRLDAIGVKGRSLTLKIMKRDPSAPVEAPKVCSFTHCPSTSFTFSGHGHSSWDMASVLRTINSQPSQTPTEAQQATHARSEKSAGIYCVCSTSPHTNSGESRSRSRSLTRLLGVRLLHLVKRAYRSEASQTPHLQVPAWDLHQTPERLPVNL
jgi:hypothetical protein